MQTILYFAQVKNRSISVAIRKSMGKKNPDPLRDREGGDEWTRTTDSRIFSPMLYQLSYITFS